LERISWSVGRRLELSRVRKKGDALVVSQVGQISASPRMKFDSFVEGIWRYGGWNPGVGMALGVIQDINLSF